MLLFWEAVAGWGRGNAVGHHITFSLVHSGLRLVSALRMSLLEKRGQHMYSSGSGYPTLPALDSITG